MAHPHTSRTQVLPNIFNRSNFKCSAFSTLKVDSRRRKRCKKKEKKKKNGIQVGVNEHSQKRKAMFVYIGTILNQYMIVCSKITNHYSLISVIIEIYRFKIVPFLPISAWNVLVTWPGASKLGLRYFIYKHPHCVQILALHAKWFLSYRWIDKFLSQKSSLLMFFFVSMLRFAKLVHKTLLLILMLRSYFSFLGLTVC